MFLSGSTCFISCVGSIGVSAFGASSSIGGNSFTGSSASIVLVISGSTSDIYNILYILSISFIYFVYMDKLRNINIINLIFLIFLILLI